MLQSASYGRLLEPGLRKIFFDTYKEIPTQYTQVFKVQDSDKAIETDYRMGGFGIWDKKDSAGPVKYQDPTGTLPIQYIHEEFASGFTVERKLIKDAQHNTINKMAASLGTGARTLIEMQSAAIINGAFTVNGFDGVPLISRTHKRLDGGGMNNQLSTGFGSAVNDGALSDRNLKGALIQARAQVNDRGILIQCNPKILVVPPALEFIALTIVNSMSVSVAGTGSGMTNDKNVIQNRLRVVVMDYISAAQGGSDTAWFLIDPIVAELNFFWREKLSFENERDFSTMQAKYQGYMRFSVGYSDYRGIVGSLGTGAA
jgi:phage major head subunit gpT-like protein